MLNHTLTTALVRKVLENAEHFEWTLQGFGMLRTYLSDEIRLHVWDSRYATENVSLLHDHPWDFASLIVAGELRQHRYVVAAEGETFQFSTIQCGPGGCMKAEPQPVVLRRLPEEHYTAGAVYLQRAAEIHESRPADGTVTLISRAFKKDTEHARVFWREGEHWVSAEPRPATADEVRAITRYALDTWFPEETAPRRLRRIFDTFPMIALSGKQLGDALDFIAPDRETDPDQLEQELVIANLPARVSSEGEPMQAGLWMWLEEYPEEGCIPLFEESANEQEGQS